MKKHHFLSDSHKLKNSLSILEYLFKFVEIKTGTLYECRRN